MLKTWLSIVVNALIVVFTVFCLVYILTGKHSGSSGITTFRYFTTLSNLLSAVTCLPMLYCGILSLQKGEWTAPLWVVEFKFVGTISVTVTFLTVMFFLGPTQGYKRMLADTGLFYHLIGPVLALVSFIVLENVQTLTFAQGLMGMLPVLVYGVVYFCQVIVLGEANNGWPDFYGFNMGGKWYISVVAMLIANFAICGAVRVGHNAFIR